jgi:hypothetical protein
MSTGARAAWALLATELFHATGSTPRPLLAAARGYLGSGVVRYEDEAGAEPGEGALLVVEVLGLIGPEQAAEWRRRFAIAAKSWLPGPPADAAQAAPAATYIERLVTELGDAPDTPRRAEALKRLEGAVAVYVQAGLVEPRAVTRIASAVERAMGLPIEDFELEQAGIEPWELEEDANEARPPGVVQRVVPAVLERHDGVCVTAVALRERGFTVHWHARVEGAASDPIESGDLGWFKANDDLGTDYARVSMSGASWSPREGVYAVHGESSCGTSVPGSARELRLTRASGRWLIPLTSR